MRLQWEKLLCGERERKSRSVRPKGDLRSVFEKDYQRIIISASFRRLQDKTQVFPLGRSDFVRTRLTHSLEVSSFAQSLGRKVCAKLKLARPDEAPSDLQARDIENILLSAGLIHDIGNPPFGHFGETTIRDFFREKMSELHYKGQPLSHWLNREQRADFLHYEGNAQALRLLSKLHYVVDEHGMNLSYALLATIMKYPVSSLRVDPGCGKVSRKKMGYFSAEKDFFDRITRACGTRREESEAESVAGATLCREGKQGSLLPPTTGGEACRHPLTFLLEAADDIAYNTADTEDAFRKGLISYALIAERLEAGRRRDLYASLGEEDRNAYDELLAELPRRREEALAEGHAEIELYSLQHFLLHVQALLLDDLAASFVEHYDEIMEGRFERSLDKGRLSELLISTLYEMARQNVFESKSIVQRDVMCDAVLSYLLERFVSAIIPFDSEMPIKAVEKRLVSLISENYKACYFHHAEGKSESEKLYLRLLLVCDFICGMTDSFALRLYAQMRGSDIHV